MDALDDRERLQLLQQFCDVQGLKLFEISAVSGYGIDQLVNRLGLMLDTLKAVSLPV
jgi:hypothetical protein